MSTEESFDTIRALIHEHGPAKAHRIVRRRARTPLALRAPGADAAGPKVDDPSEHAAQ